MDSLINDLLKDLNNNNLATGRILNLIGLLKPTQPIEEPNEQLQ